jgi:hypothetical protein
MISKINKERRRSMNATPIYDPAPRTNGKEPRRTQNKNRTGQSVESVPSQSVESAIATLDIVLEGKNDDHEDQDDILFIKSVGSKSTFKVNVTIQGYACQAVVDTAAQVTIISDEVLKQLEIIPILIGHVKLNTAGRELVM